jgi:pimeloyl-ACP methyl ester carboxylesterase
MKRFSSFDGTEIAYLDTGSGDVVVLLHGFASDHRGNWVAPGVVGALVESGRRVIAPDARGHGASDKPHDPAAYGDGAMIKDVGALLDHLAVDHIDLAGYSMGSIVSGGFVPTDSRVRRLVLGGVGGNWTGEQRPQRGAGIADALEANDPSTIENPVGRAFRAFADSTGADRLALAASQRSERGPNVHLGSISVPTLVLTGDNDALVGPPDVLAAAIPGATYAVLSGDHLTAVRDPAFTSRLVGFVNAK